MAASPLQSVLQAPVHAGRPWRRAFAWLLLLAPVFFITYATANWLAAQRGDVGSVVFAWERHIPFVAWTIVPYWSIDLFYGLSLLLPRTRAELDAHAKRLLAAQAISVLFFIALPLRFTFERPEVTGIFGWMLDVLLGFDKPFNQAPSLHISLLVVLWALYARYAPGLWRWVLHGWALLIGVSVLTTYQHHFFDIPTGILAGCLCVLLFPLEPAAPGQCSARQRDPHRWNIGLRYLASSALLYGAGVWLAGAWLWLWWPASSLLCVAGIYFYGDAAKFRKHAGAIDWPVALLLSPYLVAAWIISRCWTRKRPQPGEIVPGVWHSRLPAKSELACVAPAALVDCCAELPLDARGLRVYAVPMLDLIVPEVAQIEQGVVAIASAREHGATLVFCALGYSRSAAIVVAWLVAEGHAYNITTAEAMVRRARPELVLSPAHLTQLESWHENRIPDA